MEPPSAGSLPPPAPTAICCAMGPELSWAAGWGLSMEVRPRPSFPQQRRQLSVGLTASRKKHLGSWFPVGLAGGTAQLAHLQFPNPSVPQTQLPAPSPASMWEAPYSTGPNAALDPSPGELTLPRWGPSTTHGIPASSPGNAYTGGSEMAGCRVGATMISWRSQRCSPEKWPCYSLCHVGLGLDTSWPHSHEWVRDLVPSGPCLPGEGVCGHQWWVPSAALSWGFKPLNGPLVALLTLLIS